MKIKIFDSTTLIITIQKTKSFGKIQSINQWSKPTNERKTHGKKDEKQENLINNLRIKNKANPEKQ